MTESKTIETPAGTFTYLETGAGTPLLLLHGIGSGAASWQAQIDAYATDYRVIAWDAPGYGGSDRLNPPMPAALDYATALAAFLDALEVDSCHLVGHSLGAIMACSFARHWPDRVLSLMIGDPAAGYGNAAEEIREQRRAGRIGLLEKLGPEGLARERHGVLLSDDAPEAARKRVHDIMARIRPDGYRQAVELLMGSDIYADACKIDLPVTVVVGGADTVTPPEGCRAVANGFHSSRFEILPGLGHASYVEGPELFNAELSRHLKGSG